MSTPQEAVRKLRKNILPGISIPSRFILLAVQCMVLIAPGEHTRAVQDGFWGGSACTGPGCNQDDPDEQRRLEARRMQAQKLMPLHGTVFLFCKQNFTKNNQDMIHCSGNSFCCDRCQVSQEVPVELPTTTVDEEEAEYYF